MKAYRVEDPKNGCGLWRDFRGNYNPIFDRLSVGKARSLPMPDSDFYRAFGKKWFAATDEMEKLTAWFDKQDIIEMLNMGYGVYEFEVTGSRTVNDYEIVFARDAILNVSKIDPGLIWTELGE